ncbi:cupin domain-containing protein [Phenylobacterium sp.]|uniref:AraC family transcriptional regulator n=1 Tax=Phenylobacterium sp. TaxID=1871053 RepID=UPI0035B2E0B4
MTGTPPAFSKTPGLSDDPLSDLLAGMNLTGMILFRGEFTDPWSVDTPDAAQLARMLPFRTEHIIPFHLIAWGGCRLEAPGAAALELRAGDAVILPYGERHLLSGAGSAAAADLCRLLPPPPWSDIPVVTHGGDGPSTGILCGFLQCDELLFHPLVRHLPGVLHVSHASATADDWLATTIRHTVEQASRPQSGSRGMLPRLTELMFVEILRNYLQGLSEDEVGWFAAFKDPVVGAALRLLHRAPLEDWSVERLARDVGASRSVLADRFKHFLDLPPMRYLARWRLQLAAQQLKTSDLPLKAVINQSGYESEAAFSRAFKRHFGAPPGDWRRRRADA